MLALHVFERGKISAIRIVQMPHGGDQNDPDRMKVFAIRAYNDNRQTSRGTYFSDGSSPIWFRQIVFNRWECLRKKGLLS